MNKTQILEKARARDALTEIFILALGGGPGFRLEAAEMIRKLSPEARRDLRATLQDLDELLDDVILAESRDRRPWKL